LNWIILSVSLIYIPFCRIEFVQSFPVIDSRVRLTKGLEGKSVQVIDDFHPFHAEPSSSSLMGLLPGGRSIKPSSFWLVSQIRANGRNKKALIQAETSTDVSIFFSSELFLFVSATIVR
jgi:hypothetical protein